ncbi:MFS transporter [Crossiella cryophila]|uniref:Putative MFS transporter n=1 Tax=Crossiella cryophila TaxID=43355 RepID=A0A7W7C7Q5_9PSEU|nr:MFS transporter [Crossiella cryophila]MBB4676090.1 putative MFS transporter [Crossiella cryophila]
MTAAVPRTLPVGAAFDRMPFTRRHWLIGLALFTAFVIDSWELVALVYVQADLAASLGIDAATVGLVLSALSFGMIPGALLWGPVADRIGRRPACFWSMVAYSVLAIASAFAPDATVLIALRVVSGFALAGVYTITFPYFLELVPTRVRGRAAVYLSMGWPIGLLCAIGASSVIRDWSWQIMLAGAAAGGWAFVLRAVVPESPYWLVAKGRQEEARVVLRGLASPDAEATLTGSGGRIGNPLELFRGGLARIAIPALLVNFVFSWGYWGLQNWLPTLLAQQGLTLDASLAFAALSALMMIPGYLSASVLTARFGRKKVFLLYVLAACAGGFLFGTADSLTQLYLGNFTLAFFSLGAWGVWNTWNGEFYPTASRGTGAAYSVAMQLIASTAAPAAIGLLLGQASGFAVIMLVINAFLVATVLLALPLPETEGRTLT